MPKTLRDLAAEGAISISTGPFGSALHSSEYVAHGIPVIPTEAIKNGRLDSSSMVYVSSDKADELRRYVVSPGDILFARRGAQACGRSALLSREYDQAIGGTGVMILRVHDRGRIHPEYLARAVGSADSVAWLKAHAIGATMPNLNSSILLALPVSIPAHDEQVAIAEFLSVFDEKIASNSCLHDALETIAKTVFSAWFVDFLPVRAKAAARAKGRDPLRAAMCALSGKDEAALDAMPREQYKHLAATAALFPDELENSELGEVPDGWDVTGLDQLADLLSSSVSPAKHGHEFFEHYSIPAFDEHALPIIERGSAIKSNKYKVDPAAILVSKLNPGTPRVWLPKVNTERAVCSTEFMQFVPRADYGRVFLYLLMKSDTMRLEILKRVTGSTGSRQRAHPRQIAVLPVLRPPREVVCAFEGIVSPMLDMLSSNREQSSTLAELRDTLLPKLLSGEIRVGEARELAEAAA